MTRPDWWCDEIDRTELGWWPTYLLSIGGERQVGVAIKTVERRRQLALQLEHASDAGPHDSDDGRAAGGGPS